MEGGGGVGEKNNPSWTCILLVCRLVSREVWSLSLPDSLRLSVYQHTGQWLLHSSFTLLQARLLRYFHLSCYIYDFI